MKRLEGKWALVTGSTRGIGQQIAIGLAKEGCNVIVHGRKIENTKETLELLKQYAIKTDAVAGELSSEETVQTIIDTVKSKYEIDILYNNAGVQHQYTEYWDITLDTWKDQFQTNLYSMVLMCNAFAPDMIKRGYGRIINLSSGIRDIPQLLPYSVSKAAVDRFTSDFASQLKDTGVLVNAIDPGWLRTDLGGEYAPNDVTSVLPGALVPALYDSDGPNGQKIEAQAYNKE